jgi:RimJ/RimL family protein N-acetyltransferase
MLRRVGLHREGRLRSSTFVRRAWIDVRAYGLLRGDLR